MCPRVGNKVGAAVDMINVSYLLKNTVNVDQFLVHPAGEEECTRSTSGRKSVEMRKDSGECRRRREMKGDRPQT